MVFRANFLIGYDSSSLAESNELVQLDLPQNGLWCWVVCCRDQFSDRYSFCVMSTIWQKWSHRWYIGPICMPMIQNSLVNNDLDRAALQKDLDQLWSAWFQQRQLRFNVDKCKIMHIGESRNLQATYMMASAALETTDEEKDLGIWVDSSVKPSIHVSHAVTKANQMLGLIWRTFTYMIAN